MAIISSKDLDAQMGRTIDPNSVPRHDGGTKGAMQAFVPNQSDHIEVQQGHGSRGAPVYEASEIPQRGFYGSDTIISVNDAPPLEAGLEPKPTPIPGQAAQLVPPKPKVAAPPVVQQPQRPQRQSTAVEVLARMGLKPKP